MENYKFIINENDVDKRLDVYIGALPCHISRSRAAKLIEDGSVRINGSIMKASYKLKLHDVLELFLEEAVPLSILPENIPLSILYEEEDFLILDKPKGMVVHPAPGHSTGTLVNALLYYCGTSLSGINGVMRPGIIHRLDKDTSGVMIVAKTDFAHQYFSEKFAEREMIKIYEAICFNSFKEERFTVDKPIGRHPRDRKKMCVTEKNSRNAITHFEVIENLGKHSHVRAILETGRTHQIRVHLSSIGHPVLGDTMYGKEKQHYQTDGQVLHAATLKFYHPKTNELVEFTSPQPDYFIRIKNIIKSKL